MTRRRQHLIARDAKAVLDYLDVLKPLMRVADWQIDLVGEWCDEDAWATIWTNDDKKYARLRVCEQWTTLTPEVQRETLVHEMIHLLHRDMLEPFFMLGDMKAMPRKVFDVTVRNVQHHTEVMADTLARIIAPSMPLPEKR